MVGKSASEIVDPNGKRIGDLMIAAATGAEGHGWIDYVWPRPGESKPVAKSAYVIAVTGPDGKKYVVGVGRVRVEVGGGRDDVSETSRPSCQPVILSSTPPRPAAGCAGTPSCRSGRGARGGAVAA